ncbi:23S rRNA (uracil(1939)-C(5))-methyltransferase RlmD [Ectothiorhodospiraceae bacterium WFHF3C12]|nr:23S rRNA (uracil(1939)-C(5))-methyltransferase RlmD [Ectothiorhodospiraceae bacterium WFHF3C12]
MSRRRNRLPREPVEAAVDRLSHEGRGIAQVGERAVFITNALPGERVLFQYTKRNRKKAEGRTVEVLEAAPERIEPGCPHFGICGGCSLQHLPPEAQIRHKAQVLAEQFRHMGGVTPEQWLAPMTGPVWGYRRKARLAAKYVPAKGERVLVGFREKHSPFVADLAECPVLDPRVGTRLQALSDLIASLSIHDSVPQIEVAAGDDQVGLVFRTLRELSEGDLRLLRDFAEEHGFCVYQQPGNESTITPVHPAAPRLSYRLPAHEVEIGFLPADFTQVNAEINRKMVDRVLELMDLQPADRVLDLFCGLGNFTLPMARRCREVVGVEGADSLVERGRQNAGANGIENVAFHGADLTRDHTGASWWGNGFDQVLLDPPRTGAAEVLPSVAATGARRIVYVSCGPATLARDAGLLVHNHGYRLKAAGVMDMFPHTAHVESMAVFEKGD